VALIPLLIAGFISYLLHPLVELLHAQGLQRWLSLGIIYLLFFGSIGFAIYKGIPIIIDQVRELSESAPYVAEQYRNWTLSLEERTADWPFGVHEKLDDVVELVERKLDSLINLLMKYMMRVFDFAILIALIPFMAFYMLKDFNQLKKMAASVTPKKWRKKLAAFFLDVDLSLGGYIRGQLLVCTIIGSISALLFWITGMKYPLLLGLIVGITNVIPYFGPIVGAVPAALIAATMSVKMVLIVFMIVFVMQFLEGNILSPLIVGKSLHLHPLFIMIALLIGGEVGGIIGLIVAVPVLAVLHVTLVHARVHFSEQNEPSCSEVHSHVDK
jgi:predicted PurR-regulated permease PerM